MPACILVFRSSFALSSPPVSDDEGSEVSSPVQVQQCCEQGTQTSEFVTMPPLSLATSHLLSLGVGTGSLQRTVLQQPSSEYHGVSWSKATQKFKAEIWTSGLSVHLGHFDKETDAALKYDEQAARLGRPLNFPVARHNQQRSKEFKARGSVSTAKRSALVDMGRSQYVGVSWYVMSQKWRAQINVNGIPKYLGSFESEVEAAKKYDDFARQAGKPVNLPLNDFEHQVSFVQARCGAHAMAEIHVPFFLPWHFCSAGVKTANSRPQQGHCRKGAFQIRRYGSSVLFGCCSLCLSPLFTFLFFRLTGVRWHRANQKWTAYIRINGKQKALGAFYDEEEAARQYDLHAVLHGRPLK